MSKNSQASHTHELIYQGIYRHILKTSQLTCWTKCHHLITGVIFGTQYIFHKSALAPYNSTETSLSSSIQRHKIFTDHNKFL